MGDKKCIDEFPLKSGRINEKNRRVKLYRKKEGGKNVTMSKSNLLKGKIDGGNTFVLFYGYQKSKLRKLKKK